ncbi:SsrA-binding protein SmpB [Buchnera aphidicola]|uniref:SsrA-binding protein n=1 Tax=Buchnera aphidicola (Sarucallis kahawaluokalani) TaxID=1241878 RepID=A0A4D6YAP2_9GAMM|nr:SsrA-binding protein SmpB [Buchnera aphidicola]QCI26192.1 SsrA-binding protein SmpB [Buchnera aphidicola (Sarucallis kahawaluokalani)]
MHKSNFTDNKLHIVENKKAYYNFFIEKKIESGLILKGWEVKSIREKKIDISNGYLSFKDNEIYLVGINIQPYTQSYYSEIYQYQRNIKVLLTKKEIHYLYGKYKIKGYTLIALNLYWKKAWCKLTIAIGKGKSKQDKRLNIKNRQWNIQKQIITKRIFK